MYFFYPFLLRLRLHEGGTVAQAVSRSIPTSGVMSSRLCHSHVALVVDETVSGKVFLGISRVFSYRFPYSFHFISSASVMVVAVGHVLQLWSETVAVRRCMIYDGNIIVGDECGPRFLTFVLRLRENPRKPQPGNRPGPAA